LRSGKPNGCFSCFDVGIKALHAGNAVMVAMGGAKPWSRKEYVGETIVGWVNRSQRHVTKSHFQKGRIEKVNKALMKEGPHTWVWYPLWGWPNKSSTKIERMQIEGYFIYERQPWLNILGNTSDWTHAQSHYSEALHIPKKNRYRPLMKFRAQNNCKQLYHDPMNASKVINYDFDTTTSRTLQHYQLTLYPFVMRLGRRPWPFKGEWKQFPLVRQILALPLKKLANVYRLGMQVLNSTTRSIFSHNIKLIIGLRDGAISLRLSISNTLFAIRGFESLVNDTIRCWVRENAMLNIRIFVHVNIMPK